MQGAITEEMALACDCRAGRIVLLNGVEGRSGGWGYEHIAAKENRTAHLKGLGFRDIHAYVGFVLDAFQWLALQDAGRLLMVAEAGGYFHHVPVQWNEGMECWAVTTAIPKRNMRNVMPLWVKMKAAR